MPLNISTLNLCLGLKNKKLLIKKLLEEHEIDILCMQETEIGNDLNHNELNVSDYSIELEKNSSKSRVGFYVSKSVSYVRRCDLEGSDSKLIVIDLEGTLNTRLINVYRSFAPQNGISQRDKFKYQLTLIKNAICNMNCILLGDFNLNYTRRHDVNYSHAKYFEDFDDVL